MKIAIETIALADEAGLFGYAEAKVRAALAPLEGRLKAVRVQLEDVNGPGVGGVDKHCTVAVSLHALGEFVFDEVHSDARAAVELIAARIDGWAHRRAEQLRVPVKSGGRTARALTFGRTVRPMRRAWQGE